MKAALNKSILDRLLTTTKNKTPDKTKETNGKPKNYFSKIFEYFSGSYAIIRNIPKELHSKDLRKYFGRFVEAEKFDCFHFRHRPELQATKVPSESGYSFFLILEIYANFRLEKMRKNKKHVVASSRWNVIKIGETVIQLKTEKTNF